MFARVAVGPSWQSTGGAQGFGAIVSVAGTLGNGDCDDGGDPRRKPSARTVGLYGGVESAVHGAAPVAQPLGAFLGLEGVHLAPSRRWAVGGGARVGVGLGAPAPLFIGRGALHLDAVWSFSDTGYLGFGVEGGALFGEGPRGLPTGGYVHLPLVFRRLALPSCC